MQALIDALTALGLATGVARSATVYALVSATHVFGIACLVGPVILLDLRLLGRLRQLDAPAILVLRKTAMLGVMLAIITGILLLSAKPAEYAANRVVWAKLAVVGLAILNAIRFELMWRRNGASLLDGGGAIPAALSLLLWPLALLLGRWIAFV
jgi:hypothetical protein